MEDDFIWGISHSQWVARALADYTRGGRSLPSLMPESESQPEEPNTWLDEPCDRRARIERVDAAERKRGIAAMRQAHRREMGTSPRTAIVALAVQGKDAGSPKEATMSDRRGPTAKWEQTTTHKFAGWPDGRREPSWNQLWE